MNSYFDDDALVIVHVHWIIRVLFSIGLVFIGIEVYELFTVPSLPILVQLATGIVIDFGLFKLSGSYIKISHEHITVSALYGIYRIRWVEVKQILIRGPHMGFIGDDKRVVMSLSLASKQSKKLLAVIYVKAKMHKIAIIHLKAGEIMPITHLNSRE